MDVPKIAGINAFTTLTTFSILSFILLLCLIILVIWFQKSKSTTNNDTNDDTNDDTSDDTNDDTIVDPPTDETPNNEPTSILDIASARSVIPRTPYPTSLNNYTFNTPTTGVFPNWDTDSSNLGAISDALKHALQYTYHNPNATNSKLVRLIADDFMIRFYEKLKASSITTSTGPKIPWGTNWYEMSVSATTMLAYYLLLPNCSLPDLAKEIIFMIIPNPKKSLGYTRDGANSVYFAGPYLLAHNVDGTVEEAMSISEYKYVKDYISLPIQRSQGVDGFHLDKTFLFHGGLPAYSYLSTLDSDLSSYFYKLDRTIKSSPATKWQAVKDIIRHPSITVAVMGATGRVNNLSMASNITSQYGIQVMPMQRFIRYFTKDHQFSMRGQEPWLGFYESDHTNDSNAMYWTQYRNVHTAKSKTQTQFPDMGFICSKNETQLIRIPSTTTTTEVFKPADATSYVLAYKRYGILYQRYKITQFGAQEVTELVIIDSTKNAITVDVIIKNSENQDTVYYGCDTKQSIDTCRDNVTALPVGSAKHYKTTFDLNENSVITADEPMVDDVKSISLEDGISAYLIDNFAILSENNIAKVVCPNSVNYELDSVMVPNVGIFTFNATLNQYAA